MAILANGKVAASKSTIFVVDRADVLNTTKANIEKVSLFNPNTGEQTITLFVKERFGTSRQLRQFKLLENESGEYIEPGDSLPMENGDELEASASTDGVVDHVVTGTRS